MDTFSAHTLYRKHSSIFEQRFMILKELADTERVFCRRVKTLEKLFFDPFLKIIAEKKWEEKFPQLNLQEVRKVKTALIAISKMSESFSAQLDTVLLTWKTSPSEICLIGKLLMSTVPFMKLYADYFYYYQALINKFREINTKGKYTKIKKTLKTLVSADQLSRVDLENFLIEPVQRLPRVRLLILQMKKKTPKTHMDYEYCEGALHSIQEVLDHVEKHDLHLSNYFLCAKISSLIGLGLEQPKRYFFGVSRVVLSLTPGTTSCSVAPKLLGVSFVCFLFNDLYILCLALKPQLIIDLKNSELKRQDVNSGGWFRNYDTPVDPMEKILRLVTARTDVILHFEVNKQLKDFFYIFSESRKISLFHMSLGEINSWAKSIQSKYAIHPDSYKKEIKEDTI